VVEWGKDDDIIDKSNILVPSSRTGRRSTRSILRPHYKRQLISNEQTIGMGLNDSRKVDFVARLVAPGCLFAVLRGGVGAKLLHDTCTPEQLECQQPAVPTTATATEVAGTVA